MSTKQPAHPQPAVQTQRTGLCCRSHPHEKQSLQCQLLEVSAWLRWHASACTTPSSDSMRLYADQVDAVAHVLPAAQEKSVGDPDALRCAVGNCMFNGEVPQHAPTCTTTGATAAPAQAGEYRPTDAQIIGAFRAQKGRDAGSMPNAFEAAEIRATLLASDHAARGSAQAALVDAERYRWLFDARTKSQAESISGTINNPLPQDVVLSHLQGFFMHKAQVDEMVDAARAAQKGNHD